MSRIEAFAVVLAVSACSPKPSPQTPKPDPRVPALEKQLADTQAELEQLRQGDAELKAKAEEAKALEAKLAEVVGKAGEVTTADGAVRLELVDQILFPVGEADLTAQGKDVLAKVGAALKDVNDKQVWVQGHTDDQPIVARKPKPSPETKPAPKVEKPDKSKPGGKPSPKDKQPKPEPPSQNPAERPPATNDAVLPFVTNWELSAARALTVVHYLQDEAKIEPSRLAAVAFSQYRPVSKNRAKNRRIEIVLYPRAKISPK
jgi:chemotaxis protein MotB